MKQFQRAIMQKNQKNTQQNSEVEDGSDDFALDEIGLDDYGFIFDAEGNLKTVLMPEDYTEIPEKIIELFKLIGVTEIEDIHARVGHILH